MTEKRVEALTEAARKDALARRAKVLLYAAVPDKSMLRQGFYSAEVAGLLRQPQIAEVAVTNRLGDVWCGEYDGLVCYFYSYTAFASLLARLRGKRVVATGGGEQVFRSMAPSFRVYVTRVILFWISLLFVNRILATSSSDYYRMRKLGWFRRSAIMLSFHGAAAVGNLDRANFSSPRAAGSMVTICGMDTPENIRRKGLFRAVDLLAAVRRQEPSAAMTVIGRATRADLVRNYAAALDCADAVHFAGYVTEVQKTEILRGSRFYIQLSEYEGFGIGALEALAMGCEVVHSNVGGLRDSVAGYGRVIVAGDPLELKLCQPYAIDDWAGFERHLEKFTVDGRASALLLELGLA